MTALDTPEAIEAMRWRTVLSALGSEIRTGMLRSSRGRSTLALANEILMSHELPRGGTKRNAYEALRAFIIEAGWPVNDAATRP
jgi:hypothetical protein